MTRQKSTEMHALMTKNLATAEEYRRNLQVQQADIDEKIEDVTRVILGIKRLISALDVTEPVVAPRHTDDTDIDQHFMDAMTDLEKEIAISSAQ